MTGHVSVQPPTVDLPSLLPSAVLAGDRDAVRRRRTVRDWVVDVTCFLGSTALGGIMVAAQQSSPRPMPAALLAPDLLVGFACCVALWWRRRWPVELAVLTTLAGGFSIMSAFSGVVMLFTVAVHRRAWVGVVIAALGLAMMPVSFLVHRQTTDSLWVETVVGLLITAVALGWGMFTRARRQLLVSLQDRALRAESEQQLRVDQARRLERTRIAREMHDVLAHRISLLAVHAGALEFRVDADREQVAEAAGVIRANAHQALQELREVIGVLREDAPAPDATEPRAAAPEPPQPGLAEIPALVGESSATGAIVRYSCQIADPKAVPGSVARTAYRVVQEGLTNARKHAPGSPIDVRVAGDPRHGLSIEVANAALGLPPARPVPGAGLGLVGLGERVQLAGGRLDHGLARDGRFLLRVSLPWPR